MADLLNGLPSRRSFIRQCTGAIETGPLVTTLTNGSNEGRPGAFPRSCSQYPGDPYTSVDRSVIGGDEPLVFLAVLGIGLVFEAGWYVRRGSNSIRPEPAGFPTSRTVRDGTLSGRPVTRM